MEELSNLLNNSFGDEVTPKRIEYWFNLFNEKIFGGVLTPPSFTVKNTAGYDGWCICWEWDDDSEYEYEIQLRTRLKLKNLLEVVGHEMLHLYQAQVQKNIDRVYYEI